MSDQVDSGEKRNRSKQLPVPPVPLSGVLALPQSIHDLGSGDPVRRIIVFDRMERSPTSSTSRAMITASNRYGLTKGSYKADYLEITERGKTVITAENEREERTAVYDTLFSVEAFADFIAKYEQKYPDDAIAVDYLKMQHDLSDEAAQTCLQVIRQNAEDFGLIREFSGRPVFVSREMAMEELQSTQESITREEKQAEEAEEQKRLSGEHIKAETPRQKAPASPSQSELNPQFHFNIQIVVPENATPEKYDAMFASIAKHLLGRVVD